MQKPLSMGPTTAPARSTYKCISANSVIASTADPSAAQSLTASSSLSLVDTLFCGLLTQTDNHKTHLLRWAAGPDTMTEPGEQTAGTRIHAQKRTSFLQPRSKAERKKHPYRNGTDANCFTVPRLSPDDRFFGRERGSKGRPGNRAAAHSLQTFSGRPASQASRL